MFRVALALLVTIGLALGGCGDDAGEIDGATDGSPDGGDGGPASSVEAPMAPAPPVLGPCEGGWLEVAAGDVTFCDPYPDGLDECGDLEAHFPGGAGCERVGATCPSGDFPDDVPDDGSATFVLASASAGGDGSRGSPFRTLAEAVTAGRSTIAVGPGTYDEEANLPAGTTLRGACVERTILTNTVFDRNRPVVNPMGTGVVVRDLRIADADRTGVRADASVSIELVGVIVDRASRIGVAATSGGTVTMRDSVVRRTRFAGDEFAEGVLGFGDATITLERVVVADQENAGVVTSGTGSPLTLTDVAITGNAGPGVFVQFGAVARLVRTVIQDGEERGVMVGGTNASVVLESSLVRDITATSAGEFGYGLTAFDTGILTVQKTALIRTTGVAVVSENADVDLADVLIVDVASLVSDGTQGRGVSGQPGTTLSAARVHIERARDTGFIIGGAGTTGTVADLRVVDTLPRMSDETRGRGFHVQLGGASVSADRVLIEGGEESGVIVADASLSVRDLDVVDVASRAVDGRYGRGVEAGIGAVLDVTRLRISGSADIALVARSAGTTVTARELTISSTAVDSSAESGHGVGAYGDATITLEGFFIDQSALCGVHVADSGGLDLTRGRVSNGEIGACIQIDDYDIDRLTREVEYVDNTTNLDSTSLPVPQSLPDLTD